MAEMRGTSGPALDSGALVTGVLIGLCVGAALALWKAPISGAPLRKRLFGAASDAGGQFSQRLERAVPSDPVANSLQAGRDAARRRLETESLSSR
jgi:gas vesicle protein